MSAETMAKVMEGSRQRAGTLVVLLAIAYLADDDGVLDDAPISAIAKLARMEPRNVQVATRRLKASRELGIRTAAGDAGRNVYTVHVYARSVRA